MNTKKTIRELQELENLAMLIEHKAASIRKATTEAIEKMAGVSTPAPKKGLSDAGRRAVARRLKFIENSVRKAREREGKL